MSGELEAIAATTAHICESLWTPQLGSEPSEEWAPRAWDALAQAEFTLLPVPEEQGGAGAGLMECAVVLRELGRYGVPVPLAETSLLGGWLLASARMPVPSGPLATVASPDLAPRRVDGGYLVSGTCTRVPYGRMAERLVLLSEGAQSLVLSIRAAESPWLTGTNLAGEPRDELTLSEVFVPDLDVAVVDPRVNGEAYRVRGALGRSCLIAGALEAATEASVNYAKERVQFGKPIITFQAVQHHLAQMAGEVAATNAAVTAAVDGVAGGENPDPLLVAAAKVQAGRSAGVVARLAHQVHGAMGFTREHPLHRRTTRLWAWRDEFGTEAEWAHTLGTAALRARDLWGLVTEQRGRREHH